MSDVSWLDGDSGTIDGVRFRLPNVDAPETTNNAQCDRECELGEQARLFAEEITSEASVAAGPVDGMDNRPDPRQLRIHPAGLSITHKWLGGELDAKSDVHEPSPTSPHDHVARWRVVSSIEIAAQSRDLGQVR